MYDKQIYSNICLAKIHPSKWLIQNQSHLIVLLDRENLQHIFDKSSIKHLDSCAVIIVLRLYNSFGILDII